MRSTRLSAKVPKVPPGRYVAVAWCWACGSFVLYHKPSTKPDIGVLRVVPRVDDEGRSYGAIGAGAAAGTVILLAVAAGLARRRRAA